MILGPACGQEDAPRDPERAVWDSVREDRPAG